MSDQPLDLYQPPPPADQADAASEYENASTAFRRALKSLTNLQQRDYVLHRLAGLKQADAAREAGFSPSMVNTACRIEALPAVARALEAGKRRDLAVLGYSRTDWLAELLICAHSRITDYRFDEDGEPILEEGKEHLWRAVSEKSVVVTTSAKGEKRASVKVKVHSKLDALRDVGHHFGWLGVKPDGSDSGPPQLPGNVSSEDVFGTPPVPVEARTVEPVEKPADEA